MLLINVNVGDAIVIADKVRVELSRTRNGTLRFLVEAPNDVVIMREEYLKRQPEIEATQLSTKVPADCFGLFTWQARDFLRTSHPIERIGTIEIIRLQSDPYCCYLKPTSPAGIAYCQGWLAGRAARWFETQRPKLREERENVNP